MQHVSNQHYRCPEPGSLTRYAAVFTGWRRLCLLTALLCGVATLAAADTHGSGVGPAPVLGDLNGDGRDDVLLRHTDGRWFYYPMDGRRHITSQRGLADLTRKLDWQVAGIGDFNEDGKDDVLLRHEDGRWFYYPMNGRRHITSQRGLADLTRKLDWQVAGIGDLNGDGKDDVLLRHEDGRWFYYPMDGRRHITSQRGLADLTRKLDWRVAGIGDFNGDGKDDVLLRHTDGRWFYYPMDGRRHITSQRGLADLTRKLDWQVAGIGDFNDDGKDDVLLRHEDGRWFYYPMDGRRHITSQRGLADLTRKLDWRVAGIGDFNEDGKDDVLLRHEDGRWFYYPMDGRRHITDQRGLADLTRNPDWSIAAADPLSTPPPPPEDGSVSSEVVLLPGGVSLEMVSIPGGAFQMGDLSDGIASEKPVHTVTIKPFKLGKYEVTFAQWDACVADGGCGGYRPDDEGWGRGNRPVINVSLDDAQLFIDWLNARTGGNYRLPTEAEWEYAARAGTTTRFSWGDDLGRNRANCRNCGSQWDNEQTAPAGSFPANAWGLHDMHGNVWEGVQDCWYSDYTWAPNDGSAWIEGDCSEHAKRGGAWDNDGRAYLRSANRGWGYRWQRRNDRGFRLVQDHVWVIEEAEFEAFKERLNCEYAGVYLGEVSGDHDGVLTLVVLTTGQVFGFAGGLGHLERGQQVDLIYGETVAQARPPQFSKTIANTGTKMTGRFSSLNEIDGEWQNDNRGTRGHFSASRIGSRIDSDVQVLFRLVGGFKYSDGTLGFSAIVDGNGRIIGRGYDGHRRNHFNITAPAGTVVITDAGDVELNWDAIVYSPTPTDAHVIPLFVGTCRNLYE